MTQKFSNRKGHSAKSDKDQRTTSAAHESQFLGFLELSMMTRGSNHWVKKDAGLRYMFQEFEWLEGVVQQ